MTGKFLLAIGLSLLAHGGTAAAQPAVRTEAPAIPTRPVRLPTLDMTVSLPRALNWRTREMNGAEVLVGSAGSRMLVNFSLCHSERCGTFVEHTLRQWADWESYERPAYVPADFPLEDLVGPATEDAAMLAFRVGNGMVLASFVITDVERMNAAKMELIRAAIGAIRAAAIAKWGAPAPRAPRVIPEQFELPRLGVTARLPTSVRWSVGTTSDNSDQITIRYRNEHAGWIKVCHSSDAACTSEWYHISRGRTPVELPALAPPGLALDRVRASSRGDSFSFQLPLRDGFLYAMVGLDLDGTPEPVVVEAVRQALVNIHTAGAARWGAAPQ